jgi:hypothetical protein
MAIIVADSEMLCTEMCCGFPLICGLQTILDFNVRQSLSGVVPHGSAIFNERTKVYGYRTLRMILEPLRWHRSPPHRCCRFASSSHAKTPN